MATTQIKLPEGFVLDNPNIPEGFVLDSEIKPPEGFVLDKTEPSLFRRGYEKVKKAYQYGQEQADLVSQYLQTPTERPKTAGEFIGNLPKSIASTAYGATYFLPKIGESLAEPISSNILAHTKGEKGYIEAWRDIGKESAQNLYEGAKGISEFVGKPLGIYGYKELIDSWLTNPAGSALGVSPIVAPLITRGIHAIPRKQPEVKISPETKQAYSEGIKEIGQTLKNMPEVAKPKQARTVADLRNQMRSALFKDDIATINSIIADFREGQTIPTTQPSQPIRQLGIRAEPDIVVDKIAKPAKEVVSPLQQELTETMQTTNIFSDIKKNITNKIKLDKTMLDHFGKQEIMTILKKSPGLFDKNGKVAFDEVANDLGISTDELADKMRNAVSQKQEQTLTQKQIEQYINQPAMTTVGNAGLKVGDTYTVNGEKYKVKAIDKDGNYIIEDGDKYKVDVFDKIPQPDEGSLKKAKYYQPPLVEKGEKVDITPKMEWEIAGQQKLFGKPQPAPPAVPAQKEPQPIKLDASFFNKFKGKNNPEIIRGILNEYNIPKAKDVEVMGLEDLFREKERIAQLSNMPFRDSGLKIAAQTMGGDLRKTDFIDLHLSKQINNITNYIESRLENESVKRYGYVDLKKLKEELPQPAPPAKPKDLLAAKEQEIAEKIDTYKDIKPKVGLAIQDITNVKQINDNLIMPTDIGLANPQADRLMDMARIQKPESVTSQLIDKAIQIKHSYTRHFVNLDSKTDGIVIDVLRRFEAIPQVVDLKARQVLTGITAGLGSKKIRVFEKNIIYPDILKDIRKGLYVDKETSEPKPLPWGLQNEQEVMGNYQAYKKIADVNPDIQQALRARQEFMDALRRELVKEKLLHEEVLNDPDYFHKETLKYMDKGPGLGSGDVRLHRKRWQRARTGSELAYGTNYFKSEHTVISQALEQLAVKKTLRELEKFADITQQLEKLAKQKGLDSIDSLIPEGYVAWQPKKGHTFYKAITIPERILDEAIEGTRLLTEADKKEILAMGVKRKAWIIPERLAKTLDDFKPSRQIPITTAMREFLNTTWKQWILQNPVRFAKWVSTNTTGDFDVALAYPKILTYVPDAIKQTWTHFKGQAMTPEMMEAFERRVVNNSTQVLQEIPNITERGLAHLLRADKSGLLKGYWDLVTNLAIFRENILRLAAYKYYKHQIIDLGKFPHGASVSSEVQAMYKNPNVDRRDIAAKLASEHIGDYGNVSVAGMQHRKRTFPFWSWMEINAPRYVRLYKNVLEEMQFTKEMGRQTFYADTGWEYTKRTAGATARAGLGFAKLTGLVLSYFTLIELWNRTAHLMIDGFPSEDELNESQRQQKHILIGRNPDGTIETIRMPGALSDMLEWVALSDFPEDLIDIFEGGVPQALKKGKEMLVAPIQRLVNAAMPIEKGAAEALLGKSLYPKIRPARQVRDPYEHIARLWSMQIPYNYIMGKPTKGLGKDLKNILTYTTDSGQSAYFETKNLISKYNKAHGKEKPVFEPTPKSNALYYYKQAQLFGDRKAVQKYWREYIKLGGTIEGLNKSIKMADPLYGMKPNETSEFIRGLMPSQKQSVIRAIDWYNRLYLGRMRKAG